MKEVEMFPISQFIAEENLVESTIEALEHYLEDQYGVSVKDPISKDDFKTILAEFYGEEI